MLKLKLEFEFEEEELKEMFESFNLKFTKKRIAELKADMNENAAVEDFASTLKDDLQQCIGEWADAMFDGE